MSVTQRPPIPSFIPETAPFTVEQRTWLNGLFAGVFGLEEGVTPLSSADVAKLLPGFIDANAALAAEIDDGAPWHDPAMPLADRMKLAEGRPLPRRMMAAMAQQDCGQCGYNCHDYSQALFAGKEERLNLCVPGGKDTARMLKQLYEEIGRAPAAPKADSAPAADKPEVPLSAPGRSRDNPTYATFLSRRRLNKPGSQKETWHIEFDLSETGLDYAVGNSFGIFPANDPALVDAVIAALDAPPDFPIGGRTLREVLTDGVSLSPAPDMLFQLMSYLTGGDRRQKAKALAAGLDPDGDAAVLDVLAALQKFPGVRPDPEAFIESARCSAAARLFDLLLIEMQSGTRRIDRRCCALRGRKAHAARCRLDVPGRARSARRKDQGLCPEGATFCAAARSKDTNHHGWPRHRRCAVSSVLAGAAGNQGARPQLAVLWASAQQLRFLLRR